MDVTAELGTTAALVAALAVAVLLVGLHLLAPRVHTLPGVPQAAIGSFAGGLAGAYVFLHLLPELAEGSKAVGEALGDVVEVTPLLDLASSWWRWPGSRCSTGSSDWRCASGSTRGDLAADDEDPPVGVYWLHLSTFAATTR